MDLRVRVFCDEQGVSREEELDGLDEEALQILALDESGVIAACRLRDLGAEWKLERMAVEARVRGLGVGARLLAGAEDEARAAGAPSDGPARADPRGALLRGERVRAGGRGVHGRRDRAHRDAEGL